MLNAVLVDPLQKVTDKNFNDFGNFPRRTFDTVLADTFGRGLFYSGFACSNAGTGQLRVGAGRLYNNGVAYYNDTDGGEVLDLLRRAPVANSLWVTVVVTGREIETDILPTTYLTDTSTRDTTARNKPQESRRWAQVDPIVGLPSADPSKPLAPSDSCVVAWVLLDSSGIVRIEANTESLAPNTVEHRAHLADINGWRTNVGQQINALGTNIAAIAARFSDTASLTTVNQLARDMGRIKDLMKLPQDYSSYQSEYYLSPDLSDTQNVDYLAEVQEGIRFPPAMIMETQLQLLNPLNPDVVQRGNLVIPTYYGDFRRLVNISFDRIISLASFTFDSYEVVQKQMVRERLRMGTWFNTCTNYLYFDSHSRYDEKTRIVTLTNGERYEIAPEDAYIVQGMPAGQWTVSRTIAIRARQIWSDGFEDVAYTETFVDRSTVTGAMCGNTFLAPSDGYIHSISLMDGERPASGDITALFLEVPSNGQPDLSKVIGRCTVRRQDMNPLYPIELLWDQPVAVQKGKRYAFAVSSPGNFQLWQTKDNKLMNGSFFYITDGAWAMGDPSMDLAFYVTYCEFYNPRLEIQMQPLQLAGGIANVDILHVKYVPQGCSATFYGQFNGVWKPLNDYNPDDASPFIGLPPLVPLKLVLQGTRDNMPVFAIGPQSRVRTFRARSDFRHISKERTQPVGVPAKTVTLETRLENWRGAGFHTHSARLRYGDGFTTLLNPSVVEDELAPDDPSGATIIRKSTFVFPSPVTSYKIEQSGTTSNILSTYHVALRFDVAKST